MVFRKIPNTFCHRNIRTNLKKYVINERPKTFNDVVYPQLPFLIRSKSKRIKVSGENNPTTQLYSLTFTVSDLIRDERIKLNFNKAVEVRPHVERIIVEAMRHGDRHRPTMALANYWLREKNLVHKLFKVLVPRYSNYASSFTALHRLGMDYSRHLMTIDEVLEAPYHFHRSGEAILELRGNCLPPIVRPRLERSSLLTNVLIDEARKKFKVNHDTVNVDKAQE